MSRNYKATFVLDTRNYADSVESLIEKVTKTLEGAECEIKKVENLGQKEFERAVDRRCPNGIYVQVHMTSEPNAFEKVREKFRLDKFINRVMLQSA